MEEHYLYAKQILHHKYHDSPFYPMFVVSMFALLEKYPDYLNLITYLFLSTKIYIEDDSVGAILERYEINYVTFDEDNKNRYETLGISIPQDVVNIVNKKLVRETKSPVIVCSSYHVSPTVLLNTFIHEMNHLVKGSLHAFSMRHVDNTTICSSRIGINTRYYQHQQGEDDFLITNEFEILDEVINTLQTTELMHSVFQLDGMIPDYSIQNYLNRLNQWEGLKDQGYEDVTKLLKPLWDNPTFRKMIEDVLVEGNISSMIQEYNSIMGDGSFEELAHAVDIVDYSGGISRYGKDYRQAKKCIKTAINHFPKEKVKIIS